MPVSDSLFQLIRSLTPGEKRYFKLYAARQTEAQKTNYEKLFDEYNELPENEPYDEGLFLKRLKIKKLGKYFSDDKKHLSQLLLKAMRSYASEKKAEGRLADMIQEMNFLIEKGLVGHCSKICDRAWEIAEERELTEHKLRLLAIRRVIDRSEYNAAREAYQNDLRAQEAKALEQLTDEREAAYLYEHIYCLYVMHEMTERAADITGLYDRLDVLHQKTNLTFDANNTIIRAKCVVLDHRVQYMEALGLTKSLIAEWEKSPWRIKEMPDRYVKLLGNFMIFTSRTATYEEVPGLIQKLENIEPTEKEVAKDVFYLLMFSRINLDILHSRYETLLATIPEIQSGLREYDLLLTFVQKRSLYTIICLIYFKCKMYPKVLDAVQDVYALVGRDKEKQHRIEDIRVYEFVSHYELGNTELLHYMIRNNLRFFKEHQPENEFIDNMWKLLRQLVQATDKPKVAKQKLRSAIEALPCPDINSALQRELISWLDGK